MSFENISFSIEDGVARLRLNRPSFLNALSRPLLGEFRDALDQTAASPDARVLVLSGEGRAFSSGADLSAGSSPVGSPGFDAGAVLEDYYNPIMERMFALPVPVVAALHGPVVGAACMLSLAADVVVASRSTYFLQAFVNIGLIPDAGSSWWLPRLIGVGRASAMMLLGERIPAEKAAAWGMIYDVVDDEELEARAEAIVVKFAAGPTVAYHLTRQAMRDGLTSDFPSALERERRNQRIAGNSHDFGEGVAAFREKRKPDFTGT
ncbi:enoyl-CoA hydratase-related protein [Sphingobium sp. R-21]|uniref:enoyl-CoA hydratase-related protein n=1 Tax=Sphingobium sp. R-21 TaxID=3404056 RepID=UPI003CF55015